MRLGPDPESVPQGGFNSTVTAWEPLQAAGWPFVDVKTASNSTHSTSHRLHPLQAVYG
jgi:hypothetical protein